MTDEIEGNERPYRDNRGANMQAEASKSGLFALGSLSPSFGGACHSIDRSHSLAVAAKDMFDGGNVKYFTIRFHLTALSLTHLASLANS